MVVSEISSPPATSMRLLIRYTGQDREHQSEVSELGASLRDSIVRKWRQEKVLVLVLGGRRWTGRGGLLSSIDGHGVAWASKEGTSLRMLVSLWHRCIIKQRSGCGEVSIEAAVPLYFGGWNSKPRLSDRNNGRNGNLAGTATSTGPGIGCCADLLHCFPWRSPLY